MGIKSAAQGGGSVLSQRKADKIASDDTKIVLKKVKPAKKSMTLPTPPPKRPKKINKLHRLSSRKMYTAINTRTGKPDFDVPKVTAAQRLKQEDKFKARKKALNLVTSSAKASMKKKGVKWT